MDDWKKYFGLIGCAALVLIFGVFAIYWVFFHRGEQPGPQTGGYSSGGCANIPKPYKEIFEAAGNKWKVQPAFIAAIFYAGEHGSSWPSPNGPWASSPKGAQGPFQFMPGTWAGHKQDGNGDGVMDVQNLWDSAFGAAHLLAMLGAGGNTTDEAKLTEAAAKYNGGNSPPRSSYNSYAAKVIKAFRSFLCEETDLGFIKHILKYAGNDGSRRRMKPPGVTAIVLHWSGGSTLEGLENALEQRGLICQLGIDKDGKTYQFMNNLDEVPACQNEWNSHGIGIEIVGVGKNDLLNNEQQFQGVVSTVKKLMQKYGIQAVNDTANQKGILGHYQINPGKTDPSKEYLFKVIDAVK